MERASGDEVEIAWKEELTHPATEAYIAEVEAGLKDDLPAAELAAIMERLSRSARDTAMTREGRMVVDPETGTTATASLRKTVRVGSLSVAEETILRRHP